MLLLLLLLLYRLSNEAHGVMIDVINAIHELDKAIRWPTARLCAHMHVHQLLLHVGVRMQRALERELRCK